MSGPMFLNNDICKLHVEENQRKLSTLKTNPLKKRKKEMKSR